VAEITLRADGALEALAAAATEELLVGAGTVVNAAQVDAVVDAGAAFVVSPGLSADVVERCRERGVDVLPGVATASEVMRAIAWELRVLKLFPAEVLGGLAAVRALAAPFRDVAFLPTGGVRPAQVRGYHAEPAVCAVGGSWMAPPEAIAAHRWDDIEIRVAQAVQLAHAAL
jgi:2-dehydro-3-deoxyphosphogluconate aldolase/(4S)-4-hydroxy-2-oxoglutarate aldolase